MVSITSHHLQIYLGVYLLLPLYVGVSQVPALAQTAS